MKDNKWGGLQQQRCIVTVWRPEVQSQGAGRAMLPPRPLGEDASLHLPASAGPRCSFTVAA